MNYVKKNSFIVQFVVESSVLTHVIQKKDEKETKNLQKIKYKNKIVIEIENFHYYY